MGKIIYFPQRGKGKINCIMQFIDEFHTKYSTSSSGDVENEYHFAVMKQLNILAFISLCVYIIMAIFLVIIINYSDKENINKIFGVVCLFYAVIPLSLLVCCEIERRWQLLSKKIGHN